MASTLTPRVESGSVGGVPVNTVLANIGALAGPGVVYLDENEAASALTYTALTAALLAATASAQGMMPAADKAVLDSFSWATDYFTSSTTVDQLAEWNALIALINAETVKAVVFPANFATAISAPTNAITASDWILFSPGNAELKLLSTAGTAGRFFQIGDTSNRVDGFIIDGFYFNNDNHLSEDGSQWQIEARNCADGIIRNFTTNNGLFIKCGYATSGPDAAYSGNVKLYNGKILANVGLPNPAYFLSSGGVDVYDVYVGGLTRNLLSNSSFTSTSSWTAGTNWTVAGSGNAVKTAGAAGNLTQTVTAANIVAGATYDFSLVIDSISGGNITIEIVGDTTATSAAYTTTGTKSFSLVCPANPTSVRIVGESATACSLASMTARRATHASFRPAKFFPENTASNIDSVFFSKFDTNGAEAQHCLEIDCSYGQIGSVIMNDCYLELSSDHGILIHSPSSNTGFLRGFDFEGGRVTPTQTFTDAAVRIDNANDCFILASFTGNQIGSPRGPAFDITSTTPGANMRVSIVNNNLQSRAHGNGSDHSLIKVGGGYVSIVGNRLSLSWVNTLPYTLPTSKVAKFVEYTADAPLVHVEGNNFAQATAVEAIDVALISTLASANDHCVMNNIGNTAIVVRPEAASVHRTSLGLGNIATLDEATATHIRANTASKVLTTDEVYNALAEVTLTDAATIAVDMNAFINAIVTLADNRTLGQPSNAKIGQTGRIRIVQDGSGNRTLGYHADWKFESGVDPTLTTTAGATDILFYDVIAANFIYATLIKGIA